MSLNVAFVGLKGHWQGIAEELSLLPEARCVAAVDDDPGQLARVQDVPGITSDTHAYLTYREMLEKEVPDIVVEAGNDRDRAEMCLACGVGSVLPPWQSTSALGLLDCGGSLRFSSI